MSATKAFFAVITTILSMGVGIWGFCILFGFVSVSAQTAAGIAFIALSYGLAADARLDVRPLPSAKS